MYSRMKDADYDFIIVGAGAAGLTAAVTAACLGLKVAVLEKAARIGGTTARSEGMVWIPCNRHAAQQGIADSTEAAIAYIAAAAGSRFQPEKAQRYALCAHRMLDFIEAKSLARFELVPRSWDYFDDFEGALAGGRALRPGLFDGRQLGRRFASLRPPLPTTMIRGLSIASADLPYLFALKRSPRAWLRLIALVARYGRDRLTGWPRGTRLANGNALAGALLATLDRLQIPIFTQCSAEALIVEKGCVAGLVARTHRERVELKAKHGVLLATGGFSGSGPMMQHHFPHVAAGQGHIGLVPDENAGDGLALATTIGARLVKEVAEPAAWTPVSLVPQSDGGTIPFPHYLDRGKPGIIAVAPNGRRFTDESQTYHQFVPALIAACAGKPNAEAFLVADHRAIRRYGLGAVPPFPGRIGPHIRSGYLIRAENLHALADRLGLPAATFEAEVKEFNRHAQSGQDPAFGRGTTSYSRNSGDPTHGPNPSLAPLQTPPFYALRLLPSDIATFVALATNADAQVLNEVNAPIPGLYAAGNDSLNIMAGTYPAAGITIGSAMTFGYVAACHAAGRDPTRDIEAT